MALDYLAEDLEGVAVLGFNRPRAKNAVSRQMLSEINDAVDILKYDKNLRVLVIRLVFVPNGMNSDEDYNSTRVGLLCVGVPTFCP